MKSEQTPGEDLIRCSEVCRALTGAIRIRRCCLTKNYSAITERAPPGNP